MNIVLLVFIYISTDKPVYDEAYFYENYKVLLEKGWSTDYIIHLKNQAPGPVFQLFYYGLNKLNINVTIHLTRYFSLFFFNLGLWIFIKCFYKTGTSNFWISYFSLFSVSFIFPIIGMGLTETISMVFLSSAIFFFTKFIDNRNFYQLLLFSVFYSIALVGRQNFLVIFPVFIFFVMNAKVEIKGRIISILICLLSLLPLLYFMNIWGGLVPPEQQWISGGSILSLSAEHGLIGLGYYGILFFIVNPIFFINGLSKEVILITIVLSFIFQLIAKIKFLPFLSFFHKISFEPDILYYIVPFLLTTTGLYFLSCLLLFTLKHINNRQILFLGLLNLFMALSPFKILHQFSSRYIAQSAYLVTGLTNQSESARFLQLRLFLLVAGSAAGLYSLHIYYNQ